jgi:hypothetical protein
MSDGEPIPGAERDKGRRPRRRRRPGADAAPAQTPLRATRSRRAPFAPLALPPTRTAHGPQRARGGLSTPAGPRRPPGLSAPAVGKIGDAFRYRGPDVGSGVDTRRGIEGDATGSSGLQSAASARGVCRAPTTKGNRSASLGLWPGSAGPEGAGRPPLDRGGTGTVDRRSTSSCVAAPCGHRRASGRTRFELPRNRYRCFWSSASSLLRGNAPTSWPTTLPPLKMSRVGIDRTPYCWGTIWW